MFLPSASPELNSQENVWQFLRQNYLSSRVFQTCEDILDACQTAWRDLLADASWPAAENPWRLHSGAIRC